MNKKNVFFRVLFFLCIASTICLLVLKIFGVKDYRPYQTWKSFYNCEKDSLDAVFIGASNVYSFWSDTICWNEYGFTVFPLSFPGLPAESYKYLIEEVRKTQPNALIIMSINTFKDTDDIEVQNAHFVLDDMKLSKTKIQLIDAICENIKTSSFVKEEFYFPFIRFHSRWNELVTDDFVFSEKGIKGSSDYSTFLNNVSDVTSSYRTTDEYVQMNDTQNNIINDLLDYCDENKINILFVFNPQAIGNESIIGQLNSISKKVIDRNYPFFNLFDSVEEIGLQKNSDYYSSSHLNVHGSIKFTRYFSEILKNNYKFVDKRDNENFADWNEASLNYSNIIKTYTLDFEMNDLPRDYTLSDPKVTCLLEGAGVLVSWKKIQNADGYDIYRREYDVNKKEYSFWRLINSVDSSTLNYKDESVQKNQTLCYTVVPTVNNKDKKAYGNFNYVGNSINYILDAPELVNLSKDNDGFTITWKPVKGADGYKIHRSINGQTLFNIDTIDVDDCNYSYTDKYVLNNVPYVYTVQAFCYDNNGKVLDGTYDKDGLLYNVPLAISDFELKVDDSGNNVLTWEYSKGANYYDLYYLDDSENWVLLKGKIDIQNTKYVDINKRLGYKLVSVLLYKNEKYEYEAIVLEETRVVE